MGYDVVGWGTRVRVPTLARVGSVMDRFRPDEEVRVVDLATGRVRFTGEAAAVQDAILAVGRWGQSGRTQ